MHAGDRLLFHAHEAGGEIGETGDVVGRDAGAQFAALPGDAGVAAEIGNFKGADGLDGGQIGAGADLRVIGAAAGGAHGELAELSGGEFVFGAHIETARFRGAEIAGDGADAEDFTGEAVGGVAGGGGGAVNKAGEERRVGEDDRGGGGRSDAVADFDVVVVHAEGKAFQEFRLEKDPVVARLGFFGAQIGVAARGDDTQAGGSVVDVGTGAADAERVGDVEEITGALRLIKLGEGWGAIALAPRAAERDLRIKRLPAEADLGDGGVGEAGVAVALGAAGGVQLQRGEERDLLRRCGERQAEFGVERLHAAGALGLGDGHALTDELVLVAFVAETFLTGLDAGGECEGAGGKRKDVAVGLCVEGGELGVGLAGGAGADPLDRSGRVDDAAGRVREKVERGGAVGVGEGGVDGGLREPTGGEFVLGLREIVEDGGIPGPGVAKLALQTADEALEGVGGLGGAGTGLKETVNEGGADRGIIDDGHAERIERGGGGQGDGVEIADRDGGEVFEVGVRLVVDFAVSGDVRGEFVAGGGEGAVARDAGLRGEGLVDVVAVLRGGGQGGVEDRGESARGEINGEGAGAGGGAGGDYGAGDRVGRADGDNERAGGGTVGEGDEFRGEFAVLDFRLMHVVREGEDAELAAGGAGVGAAAEGVGGDVAGEIAVERADG